jgi:hypothetical protein
MVLVGLPLPCLPELEVESLLKLLILDPILLGKFNKIFLKIALKIQLLSLTMSVIMLVMLLVWELICLDLLLSQPALL